MAVTSVSVSVGDDAATQLAAGPTAVSIYNAGPGTIYLGGSGVTVAGGTPVVAGEHYPIPTNLAALDGLYAICITGYSADVRVLKSAVI